MTSKILIVDDSATIQTLLRDTLADDGYEVLVAGNGQDALKQIAKSRPDVVLLDLEMPGMDGIDVLLTLKSQKKTSGISVIIVTENDRDDKVVGALEVGATDVIPKPFSAAIVRARVRNVIRIRSRHKRVEAASEAKAQFLADMSHEIRTPMTAILGFADLLYNEGDISKAPPHRIAAIETIKRNGEYLLDLINNILDLSKVEVGKLEADRIRCSVVEIVTDVISMMQIRARAQGIALQVEYVGPIPETLHTDPTRLRQILINLVSNAIKFTQDGGVRLVVQIVRDEHAESVLQIETIDTGIGMTKAQIAKIFTPFNQAEVYTARKYGGTGLGLAISKHLAELLDGTICVVSEPAKGSTFTVTVGAGSLEGVTLLHDLNEAANESRPVEPEPSQSQIQLRCRVLLAEDGPDNQRLISHILKKVGARVTVADNGQNAVDFALAARDSGEPYEVILMDMQMPVMDGYEATSRLREENYTGLIVALTAHAMSADRDKCLDAGCDDYMSKPIDRKKLIETVAGYAEQAEAATLGSFDI